MVFRGLEREEASFRSLFALSPRLLGVVLHDGGSEEAAFRFVFTMSPRLPRIVSTVRRPSIEFDGVLCRCVDSDGVTR